MKRCFVSFLFALAGFGFAPIKNKNLITIKGIITDGQTQQPVCNAYIVAIQGEEESLTDGQGKFSLRTSLSLPVKISIRHQNYTANNITVSDTAQAIIVNLSPAHGVK